jgi:signal transduction histidine kinase
MAPVILNIVYRLLSEVMRLEANMLSLQHRLERLQRVVEMSVTLNSTLETERLLDLIIETAQHIIQAEGASLLLLDQQTGELHFRAATGQRSKELKTVAVPLDHSIAGYILRTGAPVSIADVTADARFYPQVDNQVQFTTRSILGVPLMVKGRITGVIEVVNKLGEAEFTADDTYILTTLAAQAAIALENSRLISDLQKAYEELNELDRLKSKFIAIASHELRTPLAVILGYATFLQRDAPEQMREQIDVVVRSALRLRSLIDDMTNLRHIDAGECELDLDMCDFAELVRGVAGEFAHLSRAKRLAFETAMPDEPVTAVVDRDKIRLAIGNLISNAIKFTPDGGKVQVQVTATPSTVSVAVQDTGIGIAHSELKRIFDRFYQVEPAYTRHYEGMGLGLSIAKSLVDIHDGRISVESEHGQGSTFTITLPRYGPSALASS